MFWDINVGESLKCYEHPELDAVGVCSECGKGICDKCVVEIGGKLYCKRDANKVFGTPKAKAPTPAPPAVPTIPAPPVAPSRAAKGGVGLLPFVGIIFCILGIYILPPVFWLLAVIVSHIAQKRVTARPDYSRLDYLICVIPEAAGALLLVWWVFTMIPLIAEFLEQITSG